MKKYYEKISLKEKKNPIKTNKTLCQLVYHSFVYGTFSLVPQQKEKLTNKIINEYAKRMRMQ